MAIARIGDIDLHYDVADCTDPWRARISSNAQRCTLRWRPGISAGWVSIRFIRSRDPRMIR